MTESRKIMISMRFDIEMQDQIKAIAEREDRSFANQLQRIVREWLREHPEEIAGTKLKPAGRK